MVGTISDDAMDAETSKGSMNWRRNEITIAQPEIRRLQQCLADQNKANAALEKYESSNFVAHQCREVELFRTIYNVRIEYYRQLQLVSVSSFLIWTRITGNRTLLTITVVTIQKATFKS